MNPIDQAIEALEDAKAALEEAEEAGDLEARLEAAWEVDECERRLLKLQIDGPYPTLPPTPKTA